MLHREMPKLRLRLDLDGGRALGPGKMHLLEAIEKTGSISGASRELGMSYTHAWLLLDDLQSCFRAAVVRPQRGGTHGGGAALAPLGVKLVELYRSIEADASSAVSAHLDQLKVSLRSPASAGPLKRPLCKGRVRRPKRAR
jgi:molybdate transport system regulatory protein